MKFKKSIIVQTHNYEVKKEKEKKEAYLMLQNTASFESPFSLEKL